jgi:hypothetical protein
VQAVRRRITDLGSSLRVVAQDVLGAEDPIDLVAIDAEGRAVVVLVAEGGEGLPLLALGLAQRAWLAPRLRDWAQLAPALGLRPEATPRLLLVAPGFDARLLGAVRAIDPEGIELAVHRTVANGAASEVLLEPLRRAGLDVPAPGVPSVPPLSAFRSGLSDADLGLGSTEIQELDGE